MDNLSTVPSTGTFGQAVNVINQNFGKTELAINQAEENISNLQDKAYKDVGYFASESALVTAYPQPTVGMYAGVWNDSNAYIIYQCNTAGTWTSTGNEDPRGLVIDSSLDATSDNPVKNKAIANELALGGIYDVTAHNNGATFASLSALLSDANLSTYIPTAVRKGGMSIKFVQTNDNKYIQARCMAQNFTTDVTQWQGVDEEPIRNSNNLVKSGGVEKSNLNRKAVLNVTALTGNSYQSIAYAAMAAPSYFLKLGAILIFKDTNNKWKIYQYKGDTNYDAHWVSSANWQLLLYDELNALQVAIDNQQSNTDKTNGVLEDLQLRLNTPLYTQEIQGLIDTNGKHINLPQFHTKISYKIPTQQGNVYKFRGRSGSNYPSVFLYNGDNISSVLYSALQTITILIPDNITHVVFSSFGDAGSSITWELEQVNPDNLINYLSKLQPKREVENYTELTPIIDMGAGLYSWYDKIIQFSDNPAYKYSKYDVSGISRIKAIGKSYGQDYSLISFVDENENAVSHLYDSAEEIIMDVPATAKYAYVNGGYQNPISAYSLTSQYQSIIPELDTLNKRVIPAIYCWGDSVTEGMNMQGAGKAEYGGECYPAQLFTMLVDGGYKYKVYNRGDGGEIAPAIIARQGGVVPYFNREISLPNDTSWVDIITSSHLWVSIAFKNLLGTDYLIEFTHAHDDISTVFIDGNYYDLKVTPVSANTFSTQIRKKSASNTATSIPTGAMMIVNVPDTPTISLLFGGYNGRTELNFEKWSGLMQKGLDASNGKGLVIGSTIAIWENWNDITGSTSAEKYQMYRNKAAEKFGNRFLDLYDLFFGHALDYCLAAGYYTDKTAEELDAMEDLLEQHILPAEMSYDYAHEGNVHPSKEGYYVIAKLVYDRLIALKYI